MVKARPLRSASHWYPTSKRKTLRILLQLFLRLPSYYIPNDKKKGGETHMTTKKTALTALTIATLFVAGGALLTGAAQADDTSPQTTMIQKLAERFNLNQDDVHAFFNEQREEHRQEMEQRHEEHLAELVANGTITEAQKQALQAKHEEMQEKKASFKDLSPAERKAQMETFHAEMESWAQAQGIDLPTIRPEKGMGGHHGHSMWESN
jgi:hypothetical protein